MAIGKKLGHSPLGFNMMENSNFDFIPDRTSQTETTGQMETREKLRLRTRSREDIRLGTRKKEEARSFTQSESEEDMPPKKIASYYLSENTILLLRQYSKMNRKSYSHVVEEALIEYLENTSW